MGRLELAFERARSEKRAALVIYLCAGDPDLATSLRLMKAIADAGADVIEVGVPFSDPTADGPVIQRASERSLAAGTTLLGVMEVVAEFRKTSEVPIVLFGYFNPILARGEENVVKRAKAAGADGFLVVDLPPEEAEGFHALTKREGLSFVPLVAPTTSDARLERVGKLASSFVYYVSITGVTGAAADLEGASARAVEVSRLVGCPVVVGFGVKTPDDARIVARNADGVVVGSAICSLVEAAPNADAAVKSVGELVASIKRACVR